MRPALACSGGVRAALRSATAQAHQHVHTLAPFAAIAAGRLQRPAYAQLLRAFFRFHLAVAIAAEGSGWSKVSSSAARLELLAADLDHLRVALPPGPTELLDLPRGDAVLGAIYVAEGSMLGARRVASQLDYLLGSRLDGRLFFAGRGQQDSLAWQRLLATLETRLTAPAALDSAIAGALAAFALIETLLLEPAAAGHHSPGLTRNCSIRPLAGS